MALMIQAGLIDDPYTPSEIKAYHINQRDEGIDLNGVSGALMATTNMQMQTFVTQGEPPIGFDGYYVAFLRKVHSRNQQQATFKPASSAVPTILSRKGILLLKN